MKDIINLFKNNALDGETLENTTLELIPETKKNPFSLLMRSTFY